LQNLRFVLSTELHASLIDELTAIGSTHGAMCVSHIPFLFSLNSC
jgi:hypothetical protein